MAKIETGAQAQLRIDNVEVKYAITSVRLEQQIDGHHVLTARLHPGKEKLGSADFEDQSQFADKLGKSVSLKIEPDVGVVEGKVLDFVGIVTQVNLDNTIDAINFVTIAAHSPTVLLDGIPRYLFYHEMKYSDIVKQVVGQHQITMGEIEATAKEMPYTVQYQETDYHFVMRLASAAGLFAHYDGKEFKMTKASSQNPVGLAWNETLGAFSMGLGTSAAGYAAHAWNPESKAGLEGTGNAAKSTSGSKLQSASTKASQDMYGDDGFVSGGQALDLATVDAVALRSSERAVARMVRCHGESIVPEVCTGGCVEVSGMEKMNGQYYITQVTHTIDDSGRYSNRFECVPIGMAYPNGGFALPPITQLQSALVTDNNDPDKGGRVKVKFPDLDQDETPWLRVSTFGAGPEHGMYIIPEVDTEVLMGYRYGDPRHPIVLGTLYNGSDQPPSNAPDPDNNVKMFMTRSGNEITFTDKDGEEEIKISQKDGKNIMVLNLKTPSIAIESEGDISIKGKTITLETSQGDLKIKSAGKVQQESTADLQIKAGMNLKAEGSLNCEVKGGAQTKVEGGAMVEVKGAMVKIN
jgi:type VI secretion system secreted protein VgrG